mgnify:CR=1 FL=1
MAREIDRGLGRVPLDANQFREGAFQPAPDPRFGGNISRANVGTQYPRGGHDIRYEEYMAPHRVDYTRNVPQQTGTPNFRPPYGAPGQPSYGEWMQQIDPFHTGPYPPKQHPNPRMRGMGGGLGGLQEQAAVDPSDWRSIIKILEAGGDPGTETAGIGSTNEYQMAKIYNNQMPGMIDEGFFWDSLTPEAEAINKVLNMPGIEGMRQGSESDWNYDDYNKMIPDWLREQLPEDAFENLYDFRNQQRITT